MLAFSISSYLVPVFIVLVLQSLQTVALSLFLTLAIPNVLQVSVIVSLLRPFPMMALSLIEIFFMFFVTLILTLSFLCLFFLSFLRLFALLLLPFLFLRFLGRCRRN